MTPLKLTLKNFIGVRAGLGLDVLDLDLTTFDDAQLIALKGPNGAGKSTILDNLHPYRLMPSRAGGYSPASFSYYDQTFGDAEKVLEWEHEGRCYRSTLIIKGAGKTKKTEAYLFEETPADEGPRALNDGKTATYDAAVEAIIGSPEMFFTAAFSAQGRASLSSYKNSEIKGLMSELLGLDHILEMGDKAADVAKLFTAQLTGVQQRIGDLSRKTQEATDWEQHIRLGEAGKVTLETNRKALQESLPALADAAAEARANVKADQELTARRASLNNSLQETRSRTAARVQEIRADIDRENAAQRQRENAYQTAIADIQRRIDQAEDRMARAIGLLADRDVLEKAAGRLPEAKQRADETAKALEDIQARTDQLAELRAARAKLIVELNAATANGRNLAQYVDDLLRRAELADRVPCVGMDLQSRCQLLGDAITARDEIPAKSEERDNARSEYQSLLETGKTLDESIASFGNIDAVRVAARKAHDIALADVRLCETATTKLDSLAATEQDLKEAQAESDAGQAAKKAAFISHEAETEQSAAHVLELANRAAQVQEQGDADALAIQEQLAAIPASSSSDEVAAAEKALQAAHDKILAIDKELATTSEAITIARTKLAAIGDQALALKTAQDDAERLGHEIASWRLLSTALGHNGIIALSIDDAGPTLASIANDLLLSCYGPRFTVSIQTQEETAKGDQRETFDILVFDGERGESKSVRDMSGGERVYINDTLTRAIALYQAQQSGRHYGTLFADESDGALDPARKVQFMRMKRRILELGGYQREILITHTPELIDLADAVIDLEALRVSA